MKKIFFLSICILSANLLFADKWTWTQKADYSSTPRHRAQSLSCGGKGYLGFGHVNSGTISNAFQDWWEFDPATNSWTQKADYPIVGGRFATAGFTIGNKCYVGTGNEQNWGAHDEFYEYDPATNVWTAKANFPVASAGNIGFSINGKGYLGCSSTSQTLYEYDPTLDTWTIINGITFGNDYSQAFVLNNKGYIVPAYSDSLFEFDPSAMTITRKANFIGVPRFSAATFAVGGIGVIALGGDVSYQDLGDAFCYNPITDSWDTLKSFPGSKRKYNTAFNIGDKGYLGTGSNGTNLNDFWEFSWKNSSTGIDELSEKDFSVFPNPSKNKLTISCAENFKIEKSQMQIFDVKGNVHQCFQVNSSSNLKTEIDISPLPNGAYFIHINAQNQKAITLKFVKE